MAVDPPVESILYENSSDKSRSFKTWLSNASSCYELPKGEIFDGRRFIFALALLEKRLFRQLSTGGFLDRIRDQITQQSSFRLSTKGVRLLATRQPRRVAIPIHDDAPADEDELGRELLAHVLANRIRTASGGSGVVFGFFSFYIRLRRLLGGKTLRLGEVDPAGGRATLFHVDGPWGAGKTSILNFVRKELRAPSGSGGRWVVVYVQRVGIPASRAAMVAVTTKLRDGATRELWAFDRSRAIVLMLWSLW
jgi:hypothetical protein